MSEPIIGILTVDEKGKIHLHEPVTCGMLLDIAKGIEAMAYNIQIQPIIKPDTKPQEQE